MSNSASGRGTERVRFDARRRQLTVTRVTRLTPRMVRVTLGGADLAGFTSQAPDDHVKLFFATPPAAAPLPPGSDMEAAKPPSRDYTPRRYDAALGELDIEFSLHGDGPAATWAAQARVGDTLSVGGPRGSFVVRGTFDWWLLVGDDAGLPAIARRLAELPAGTRAFVVVEVDEAAEEQALQSQAAMHVTWLHRNGAASGQSERFAAALRALHLPAGVGYTWIGCESNVARTLRQLLLNERGFDRQWLKASGYWKLGASATHDKIED